MKAAQVFISEMFRKLTTQFCYLKVHLLQPRPMYFNQKQTLNTRFLLDLESLTTCTFS